MLARSKLNSIEALISQALINNESGHEEFSAIINEERNYRELKESIRIMKCQKSDTEKNNLIGEGQRISIDKTIKRNVIIDNNLKSEV